VKRYSLALWAVLGYLSLTPLTAYAVPVVRTFKQSQVSGTTATLQTINVWDGHGVSISFYQINEIVKRVWIDDPSQILIDTDGCLEGINKNCQSSGAGLIHLRRIKRLDISGMPKTWATHLTIVTETSAGDRKSYHFQVAPSNGKPKYSQISIVEQPDIQPYVRPINQIKPNQQPKRPPEISNTSRTLRRVIHP
jgi:hypothetical protein